MTPRRVEHPLVELQIAPMIDVCFLLLFFYILTTRPDKPEADLGTKLPATVEQGEPVEIPDTQRIEILPDGAVVLNEQSLGAPGDRVLPELRRVLERFRESADSARTGSLVTIAPEDAVPHQRIVDVMNACAAAGLREVTFAAESDEETW
jgi:biopolymer transport protein ExbD